MDPYRKVRNGEPFVPSAEATNAGIDAARAARARQADVLRSPIRHVARPTIVSVLNTSEDTAFSMWQPILVGYQTAELAEARALSFAAGPYFPGYLPSHDTYETAYPVLGITQEPIGPGRIGRVCVSGPTFALMQQAPAGWTNVAGWSRVHLWHVPAAGDDPERWVLRNGPGGDARVLQIIDPDHLYQDGTYNDQYLVWIDLAEFPERQWIRNTTGAGLPAHSIVRRTIGGSAAKLGATSSSTITFYRDDLFASPGYEIANGAYGWGYRLNGVTPVKVRFALDYLPTTGGTIGPAGQNYQAWPALPGMLIHGPDWYQAGEPYYVWVFQDRPKHFYAKKATSASIYLCLADGSAVYDGTLQGGITYPTMKVELDTPQLYTGSSFTQPRDLNIQVGQVFVADGFTTSGKLIPNAAYLDDPIGTVKMWSSEADPPPGWREVSAWEGRVPVCLDPADGDFDELDDQGGAKTHTHSFSGGGGVAAGSGGTITEANHLPPYFVVRFIERYQ